MIQTLSNITIYHESLLNTLAHKRITTNLNSKCRWYLLFIQIKHPTGLKIVIIKTSGVHTTKIPSAISTSQQDVHMTKRSCFIWSIIAKHGWRLAFQIGHYHLYVTTNNMDKQLTATCPAETCEAPDTCWTKGIECQIFKSFEYNHKTKVY
jgi:hypothetical protein